MGDSKIGIFTIKKMQNKAIPGFFGEANKDKKCIACAYNKEANWLIGISTFKGYSNFHIYRKG
jgi:hypothetical protein